MEKLIVGFSKPKKFKLFAWIIMHGYGTPYDHVYMKFHSTVYDRDIIYQASKMMINFMGTQVFESENEIVREFTIDISTENKVKLMQFAIDNAGKPYSWKEAFGIGLVKFCSLFGKNITNPFREGNNEYVCSVLAECMLENCLGKDIPQNFQDASPEDLYKYLEEHYG